MGAAEWLRDYEADTENGKKNTVDTIVMKNREEDSGHGLSVDNSKSARSMTRNNLEAVFHLSKIPFSLSLSCPASGTPSVSVYPAWNPSNVLFAVGSMEKMMPCGQWPVWWQYYQVVDMSLTVIVNEITVGRVG